MMVITTHTILWGIYLRTNDGFPMRVYLENRYVFLIQCTPVNIWCTIGLSWTPILMLFSVVFYFPEDIHTVKCQANRIKRGPFKLLNSLKKSFVKSVLLWPTASLQKTPEQMHYGIFENRTDPWRLGVYQCRIKVI